MKVKDILDLLWAIDEIKKLRIKMPIATSLCLLQNERVCNDVKATFNEQRQIIIDEMFIDKEIMDDNGIPSIQKVCETPELFSEKMNELLLSPVEINLTKINGEVLSSYQEEIDINIIYALAIIFE